jgi:hypothetical protein
MTQPSKILWLAAIAALVLQLPEQAQARNRN